MSADSISRSSRVMSSLITYGRDKLPLLEKVLVTSKILINLTKTGLGRDLLGVNFSNLWQSLTEVGSIELLMLERAFTTLLRSDHPIHNNVVLFIRTA